MGANIPEMLDVYQKQAVPVWEPGLTQLESKQIERVQKAAFYIILGEKYTSYSNAVAVLDCDLLSDRRLKLCLTFARKCFKHPKYQNWFCPNPPETTKTRAKKTVLKMVNTRTDRYEDSPIPYLTKILDQHLAQTKK